MAFIEASAGTRYIANQNFSAWFVPTSGFANWASPTVAEINAGVNLTLGMETSTYSFGTQASTQVTSHSFAQTASTQVRGFPQFGGDITFYYPKVIGDTSNLYATLLTLFQTQWTSGYIVIRVDGAETSSAAAIVAGDLISIYKVKTDAYKDATAGENPYTYTITFLPQGNIATNVPVKTTADVVVVSPSTATVAVGALAKLTATVNGRTLTYGGVQWSSSAPSVATVSDSGIVQRIVATTSVTITATYAASGVTATATIS